MSEEIKTPKLTGTAKLDAITDAAYAIIDKSELDRDAKTNRLKALRLAKEAADREGAASSPSVKPSRKRKAS